MRSGVADKLPLGTAFERNAPASIRLFEADRTGGVGKLASRASQFLTTAQISCLELVAENLTSKEIAAELGISRHTVDQRVRGALRKLGVENRRQAVRLLESRQRFQRAESLLQERLPNSHSAEIWPRPPAVQAIQIPLPFATAKRPSNTMGIAARLGWIVGIALAAFISMATYLAGLESLTLLLCH
jgi:DNA-binding CsgD family transcriptional regulator